MMTKKIMIATLCANMLLFLGCANSNANNQSQVNPPASPVQQVASVNEKNSTALFETSKGNFRIELFEDKAPITAKNFITLANKGFYDGLIFTG
jgi:peptidyl-prolyl cis-trans isomerase A (cyclophilin A)